MLDAIKFVHKLSLSTKQHGANMDNVLDTIESNLQQALELAFKPERYDAVIALLAFQEGVVSIALPDTNLGEFIHSATMAARIAIQAPKAINDWPATTRKDIQNAINAVGFLR